MEYSGRDVQALMDAKGLTAYDIAPILGITAPGVYNIVKRKKINKIQFKSIEDAIKRGSIENKKDTNIEIKPQAMTEDMKEIIESNKHYRATIDRQLAIIEQLTGMNRQQGKAA